jgi:hypothetical protein
MQSLRVRMLDLHPSIVVIALVVVVLILVLLHLGLFVDLLIR